MIRIDLFKYLTRILIYAFTTATCIWVFYQFTNLENLDKKEILSILISVISIIIAIVVTYLFSKLFADKAIRIERKKEIDILSRKITYLRRIAFHLRGMHKFWQFKDVNIKSIIDRRYKELTYEAYRGNSLSGQKEYTYEEISKIHEEIYGTDGQAYLALKGLEDGENSFSFFSEFNPRNYSLNDITRYKEYSGSFWYFLENSSDDIVNFEGLSRYWLSKIDELFYKIKGRQVDGENYKKELKDLLQEYDSIIFEKHYFLTSSNSEKLPRFYVKGLSNMMVFLTLLVVSVFTFVLNLSQPVSYTLTIMLLSVFVANTVDLTLITFQSIKSELEVDEIYKI